MPPIVLQPWRIEGIRHGVVEPQQEVERHQPMRIAAIRRIRVRAVLRPEMPRVAKFAEDAHRQRKAVNDRPTAFEADIPVAPLLPALVHFQPVIFSKNC